MGEPPSTDEAMPSTENVGADVAGPMTDDGATGAFPPRCALSDAGTVNSNGIESDAIVTVLNGFGARGDRRASVTGKVGVSVDGPQLPAQAAEVIRIL